jgi:hypothetical protein
MPFESTLESGASSSSSAIPFKISTVFLTRLRSASPTTSTRDLGSSFPRVRAYLVLPSPLLIKVSSVDVASGHFPERAFDLVRDTDLDLWLIIAPGLVSGALEMHRAKLRLDFEDRALDRDFLKQKSPEPSREHGVRVPSPSN